VFQEKLLLFLWNQSELITNLFLIKLDSMPTSGHIPMSDVRNLTQIYFQHITKCSNRYFGDMDIPDGKTIEDAQKEETEKHFPKNVATLRSRWTAGMNFGEFSEATFSAFY